MSHSFRNQYFDLPRKLINCFNLNKILADMDTERGRIVTQDNILKSNLNKHCRE